MNLENRLAISFYKTIATINEPHNIYLVQHQESHKIYVKKILDIYNINVYNQIKGHPILGTPKIIELCENENQLIIIEEYISGESLEEKIHHGALSKLDILEYMINLCETIEGLHTIDPPIIHRDIKPSNIIITPYNKVILLDFNAAKNYNNHNNQEATDTVLLGTQGYAAPEQYGFGSSTPQTDIYAMGILLKEMLESISLKSDSLNRIIERCTMLNPNERYASIHALKHALLIIKGRSHTKKETIQFLPPGFRTRTPWKMVIAVIGYFIIFIITSGMNTAGASELSNRFDKVVGLIMLLSYVAINFNYMDIQQYVPLCQKRNPLLRLLGIALMDIVLFIIWIIILFIFQSIYIV